MNHSPKLFSSNKEKTSSYADPIAFLGSTINKMVHMPQLLLGLIDGKPFQVDANLIATGRTCVLGSSGSGKSYAVGVICEELCKNHVPFVIIDTEGEYSGLKEKYDVIWVGEDQHCDLNWKSLNLERLAQHALDSAPLILDLSETVQPRKKISAFLSEIYREVSKRRTPYLVILEEADKFAPQVGERLQIFNEVARRGRKRGLGLMICTQRPSLVDKNILSQCGNQLIGRLVIKNDLQAIDQFFPERGSINQVTTLTRGAFYALGNISSAPTQVQIRLRETRHGGMTPKLEERRMKKSTEVLAKVRNSRREKNLLGITSAIDVKDVSSLVKRGKSLIFFGEEEVINEVKLVYHTLVEIGVLIRKGLLKKKLITQFFVLDGVTGRYADLGDHLAFRKGLEPLIGLDTLSIEILQVLKMKIDSSLTDVAKKINVSETLIRKPMKDIESKRLVRSSKVGKTKMFRRLTTIPRVHLNERSLELKNVIITEDTVNKMRIKRTEVGNVVKGLLKGSEMQIYRPFFYPVYRVELSLKGKKRIGWVDGVTGRNIDVIAFE